MKDPKKARELVGVAATELAKMFGARAFISDSCDSLMETTAEAKKNNTAIPAASVDTALKAIHTNLDVAAKAEENLKTTMAQLDELMKD